MNTKLILTTLGLIAIAFLAFVLFGRFGTHDEPAEDTSTSTPMQGGQISNVRILRTPDSMEVESTMCQNVQESDRTLEIIVRNARIQPTCLMANDNQRIRFENETAREIVVSIDRLPPDAAHLATTTIAARSGTTLDLELGRYLAQGVHHFTLSDGRMVEIVVLQ
jgi:hypothetical protein